MNDATTIIVPCKNNDKIIQTTYTKLNDHIKQHHSIERIIYVDLNSTDLTITLLTLLINQDKNLKNIIIKHKKPVTLGQAINNAHKITLSNNIIIIEPELKTLMRTVTKEIKLLRKAHIIIPDTQNTQNVAYKKNFIKFKSENNLKEQLEQIANKKKLRVTRKINI